MVHKNNFKICKKLIYIFGKPMKFGEIFFFWNKLICMEYKRMESEIPTGLSIENVDRFII